MEGQKFEVKKDCFGYCAEKNGCSVLRRLYCKTEECGFYKTKEQYDEDRKKWGFSYLYDPKMR